MLPLRIPDYNNPLALRSSKLISRSGSSIVTDEDRAFMDMLDGYLLGATVAVKSGFTAKFALKVTWENVSSADNCTDALLQTPTGCPVSANDK